MSALAAALTRQAGIHSWTPAWICLCCQAELRAASVSMPLPRPPCHCCHALMIWEVDLQLEILSAGCAIAAVHSGLHGHSICARSSPHRPCSHLPRSPCVLLLPHLLSVQRRFRQHWRKRAPSHRPTCPQRWHLFWMCRTARTPALRQACLRARGPLRTSWITHAQGLHASFHHATHSCVYVPLLLDAAGMLHAKARAQWRAHPAFAPWWQGAVTALLERLFLSVREVRAAVGHVLARFDGFSVVRIA